jgi:hypothetical protein
VSPYAISLKAVFKPLANGGAAPGLCPIYCVHSLSVALEEKYPAPGFIHFGEGKVRLYWIRDIAKQKGKTG